MKWPQSKKRRRIADLERDLASARHDASIWRASRDRMEQQMAAATEMLRPPPTMSTSMPVAEQSPIINGWQKVERQYPESLARAFRSAAQT